MYSKKLEQRLKKAGISPGDEISVTVNEITYSGVLMPRPSGSEKFFSHGKFDLPCNEKNRNILVLKLENGYNVGLDVRKFQDLRTARTVSGSGEDSKAQIGRDSGAKHGCDRRSLDSENAKLVLLKKAKKQKQEKEATTGQVKKDGIVIVGCGGTIASKVEYTTGAVYPAISTQELRAAFPALDKLAPIHSRQLFSIFSEDMNHYHWKILAKEIEKELRHGVNGVVVLHGTDTMSYTSAALSFMLQNLPAPVILVGAQRSSDRPSSENEINLMNAVFSAKQDIGEVAVCMHATINDDYCYLHHGTKVRKMHTSRRDAFRSINSLPIAKVDYGRSLFEPLSVFKTRSNPSELKVDNRINPNVAMVYFHPGLKPEFIKKFDCYDGVVLMATGLGHLSADPFKVRGCISVLPAVKDLVASGIPVVIAPQTISGRINLKVYTTGRLFLEAGVIGHGADWTPESAFVKLCWVLGREKKMQKIHDLMFTNFAGELSDRSQLGVGWYD